MQRAMLYLAALVLVGVVLAGLGAQFVTADPPAPRDGPAVAVAAGQDYTLETALRDGRMVYVGVGGAIDGVVNPELVAQAGTQVRVTLRNGDGMAHDFALPDLGVQSPLLTAKGVTAEVLFTVAAGQQGRYDYFCTTSGHRQAGMVGSFVVR